MNELMFPRKRRQILGLMFLVIFGTSCATPLSRSGRVGLIDATGTGFAKSPDDLLEEPDPDAVLALPGEWQWPLTNVAILSPFGERGRKFHRGIDLRAPTGTPVFAASDGQAVYVGSKIRGYGRMIVLKHPKNIFSVYAHHSKNLIKSGQTIRRGDQIAWSGRSGRVTGPHLHFEIRQGTLGYDPALAINDNMRRYEVDRRFASVKQKHTSKSTTKKNSRRRNSNSIARGNQGVSSHQTNMR